MNDPQGSSFIHTVLPYIFIIVLACALYKGLTWIGAPPWAGLTAAILVGMSLADIWDRIRREDR